VLVLVLRRSLCRFTTVFHAAEISLTVSRDTESPCPKLPVLRQSPSPAPSNPPSSSYLVASYCSPATPSCVVAGVVAMVVPGTSSVLPSRHGDLFLSTIRYRRKVRFIFTSSVKHILALRYFSVCKKRLIRVQTIGFWCC
jgi:hypothetical protein